MEHTPRSHLVRKLVVTSLDPLGFDKATLDVASNGLLLAKRPLEHVHFHMLTEKMPIAKKLRIDKPHSHRGGPSSVRYSISDPGRNSNAFSLSKRFC